MYTGAAATAHVDQLTILYTCGNLELILNTTSCRQQAPRVEVRGVRKAVRGYSRVNAVHWESAIHFFMFFIQAPHGCLIRPKKRGAKQTGALDLGFADDGGPVSCSSARTCR